MKEDEEKDLEKLNKCISLLIQCAELNYFKKKDIFQSMENYY